MDKVSLKKSTIHSKLFPKSPSLFETFRSMVTDMANKSISKNEHRSVGIGVSEAFLGTALQRICCLGRLKSGLEMPKLPGSAVSFQKGTGGWSTWMNE